MSELLENIRKAAEVAPPPKFSPGVVYTPAGQIITTPPIPQLKTPEDWAQAVEAMGVPIPEGFALQLVEAVLAGSTTAWHRDEPDKGAKHTAYTKPSSRWSYRFKVVPVGAIAGDADFEKMRKAATKAVAAKRKVEPSGGRYGGADHTLVINLADFQVGKTDQRGGTPELLERSEHALAQVKDQIRLVKPAQIILADNGDSTEMFESAPNAARTNDLQQTEQIRAWRQIFWRWISEISRLTDDLIVVSVPSNHCSVRAGKNKLGTAHDDWGLEVLAQVRDIAAANPEAYGHVRFYAPRAHEEHVLIETLSGTSWGLVHGHQAKQPAQAPNWVKRLGRAPLAQADIVQMGHFHHLRVVTFGDNQTLFISPTMDGGSAYFTAETGERSDAGVMTYVVDGIGWRDLFVAWC